MATTTKSSDFGHADIAIRRRDGSFGLLASGVHDAGFELEGAGEWVNTIEHDDVEFSCEISMSPESRKRLIRQMKQAVLDDLVKFVRMSRSYGYRSGIFEMADEQYVFASAIVHQLHGMNLTRYFRSRCRFPARGIRVLLPSGSAVWRK